MFLGFRRVRQSSAALLLTDRAARRGRCRVAWVGHYPQVEVPEVFTRAALSLLSTATT